MHFFEMISCRILKLCHKGCQGSVVNIGAAYKAMTWANDDHALCYNMTSLGAKNHEIFEEIFALKTIPIQTHEYTTAIN